MLLSVGEMGNSVGLSVVKMEFMKYQVSIKGLVGF